VRRSFSLQAKGSETDAKFLSLRPQAAQGCQASVGETSPDGAQGFCRTGLA